VRVFSTACDFASTTSVVSKWRHLQSGKQRSYKGPSKGVGWVGNDIHFVSGQNSLVKREMCEVG
jgi:hypothetical protein